MHQKKSEVQIGKKKKQRRLFRFQPNPTSGFPFFNLCPPKTAAIQSIPSISSPSTFYSIPTSLALPNSPENDLIAPSPSSSSSSTPYKRTLLTQTPFTLSKSPTLYQFPSTPPFTSPDTSFFSVSIAAKSAAFRFLHRFKQLRHVRNQFRFILLLFLPLFYLLISHPSHSFLLDFLSAFAFSAALLFSLNLAIPRLPSVRLFLTRSFPVKLKSYCTNSRPQLPVFWSVGSGPKSEKRVNSVCWVQVYKNGDVYEGEFHKGKCSGSGVYYYYMSGRYERHWVDGKYDGYGVETRARGSRYRGQYRQGLRMENLITWAKLGGLIKRG